MKTLQNFGKNQNQLILFDSFTFLFFTNHNFFFSGYVCHNAIKVEYFKYVLRISSLRRHEQTQGNTSQSLSLYT